MRRRTGRPVTAKRITLRSPESAARVEDRTIVTRTRPGRLPWSVNVPAIERERVLRGWTRGELARTAHVDEKTLRDMLSGRRRPTFGTVQAVCTALGLTLPNVIVFEEDG